MTSEVEITGEATLLSKTEPDENKMSWVEQATKEQQFLYESLGDRDWDSYMISEWNLLERNIGHALYGSPNELPDSEKNEETGYNKNKLEHIKKICAVIKEQDVYRVKTDNDILVAVVFVLLNRNGNCDHEPVFRIPKYDSKLENCYLFIDSNSRIYKGWEDYLKNNQLPQCMCCYPKGGVYIGDENDKVLINFGKTPACKITTKLLNALDGANSAVTVGSTLVGLASLACIPVAAPILLASSITGVTSFIYGTGRSVSALVDKGKHGQSIGLKDSEARSCYLTIVGGTLGMASGAGVKLVSRMAQNGEVMSKAGRILVTALNMSSLAANGAGVLNSLILMRERHKSGNLTNLEIFQFASQVLFFTNSLINIKTANAIIKDNQKVVLNEFEASLRSNKHRRMYRRLAMNTRGEQDAMHGDAKVIKAITHIENPDDFFASLVKVSKEFHDNNTKISFANAGGHVEINEHIHVDPVKFNKMHATERQVILKATKSLCDGSLTHEAFHELVEPIYNEHSTLSNNTNNVTSVQVRTEVSKSALSKIMNTLSSDATSFARVMGDLAKTHHNDVYSIALKVARLMNLEEIEEIIRIVKFVRQFVQLVSSEMEQKYQEDLRTAMSSLGETFNQEEFDHNYNISGNRAKHFMTTILHNYNTCKTLLLMIKSAFQRFSSMHSTGDRTHEMKLEPHSQTPREKQEYINESQVVPDHFVDTNVYDLDKYSGPRPKKFKSFNEDEYPYFKHRDFSASPELSDEECFNIADELTGILIDKYNAILSRDGPVVFVTVTDPNILVNAVMIVSHKEDQMVAANVFYYDI